MMGFGLPDDNLHAPNEKFHIPNFYRGIESICLFFEKLAKVGHDQREKLGTQALRGDKACRDKACVGTRLVWGQAPSQSRPSKARQLL